MEGAAFPVEAAPRTFFGVPTSYDLAELDAHVAFLGVPYDGGTPQPGIPTGQRAGPAAAREASTDQIWYPGSAPGHPMRAPRAGTTSRRTAITSSA
jgi:arginase family enzyme